MHDNIKEKLTYSINDLLLIIQPLAAQFVELYSQFSRVGNSQWSSAWATRPNLTKIFIQVQSVLDKLGNEFIEVFRTNYPSYEHLVGFRSFGLLNILHDPSYILRSILCELWNRHKTFQVSYGQVDTIVQEFADFVDCSNFRFRYFAQLLNYKMAPEIIPLTNDINIRQLSEKEINEIYANPSLSFNQTLPMFGPHDFILEGEFEERKVFGNQEQGLNDETIVEKIVKPSLDKAILALRTFQSGRVGYNMIRFKPIKFCPVIVPGLGNGNLYVPIGIYNVSEHDVENLQRHSKLIFSSLDTPLETACKRLSDAETRTSPQDSLFDAVVGLEAILLADLNERGELRFRFAMNYSTLFDTPEERLNAFNIAKKLYDLRSTIAHGSTLKKTYKLGDENLTVSQTAQKSCQILRNVINYFLDYPDKSAYKKSEFWVNRYFGIKK
ncbi:MAG: hypothetical protein KME29_31380 [Calothrix sp. FI2-JRJ7]|jgi:hypothetical protein|nr:hypothetical protein [Calothrix sp. FI2-JRJ7]